MIMENFDEIVESRKKICSECGLYLETPRGHICNHRKYLDMTDKTTVYDTPGPNRRKGCSCNMDKKIKLPFAKCVCGKW